MKRRTIKAISGRTIVITGAARGIGAATARELAAAGAQLILLDLNEAELAAVASELGASVRLAKVVDLRDSEALARVGAEVAAQGWSVDVLINNAAVYAQGPISAMALADFEWCVDVNLLGTLRCCRVFLPLMKPERSPQIINVLSEFAAVPFPNKSSYCVSKAGARMLSACLRLELAPRGIEVTDFIPPAVDTGLVSQARTTDQALREREAAVVRNHAFPVRSVAHALCDAIASRRRVVTVGLVVRLSMWAAGCVPSLCEAGVARVARRLQLS